MREIATKKKPVFLQANSNSGQCKVTYTISRAFVSCLGCQHFISDWLGKLKPNKLSTGYQNELKGAAVEKATNPGRRFLFFSRLRRSFSHASRANFAATPLLRPARQNRRATQAIWLTKIPLGSDELLRVRKLSITKHNLSISEMTLRNARYGN